MWARSLAWPWAQCTVWKLQVHGEEDRLLLSAVIIHAASFCQPEVSPGRTDNIPRSHLQFLPKIPLWIESHRAVLGSSKVLLLHKPKDGQHQQDGGECESMSQWRAHSSNQMVWYLFPCLSASNRGFSLDMPTDQLVLSTHTHRVCQAPEATWANRKYHSHRCLPPDILADLKKKFEKKYGGDK